MKRNINPGIGVSSLHLPRSGGSSLGVSRQPDKNMAGPNSNKKDGDLHVLYLFVMHFSVSEPQECDYCAGGEPRYQKVPSSAVWSAAAGGFKRPF